MTATTLHLTNAWHPTSGGIRTFYRALLDRAVGEGRRMAIVVPSDRTCYERVGATGGIYYLRAPRSPVFDTRYRLLLPHRYLRPSVSAVWRVIDQEQPDLVEICDKYALVHLAGQIKARARGRARPTVVGLSCERMDDNVRSWLPGLPGGAALARAYMRRVYLPQFDAHVANSAYTAAELLMHAPAPGVEAGRLTGLHERVHVCPMGVEAGHFRASRRRRSLRASLLARAHAAPGDALLLYAGRLSPEKNVELLPGVAAYLSMMGVRFRLIVAGDGPLLGRLRDAASRLPASRVAFYGHIGSREELADLLANVDMFVHPNPREPFGIGPLEAMASGTPVIVPDAGGVLEYATPFNAWLAPAEAGAFARTIARALDAPALRAARAREALATADAFAWSTIASRMLALYDGIHARRSGAGERMRSSASAAVRAWAP